MGTTEPPRSPGQRRAQVRRVVTKPSRHEVVTDPGLQHERTSLAWERTAISTMASGVLLARFASQTGHLFTGLISLLIVVFGSGLLVWTALHYDDLHSLVSKGHTPAHPAATRFVGRAVVVIIGLATTIVVVVVVESGHL